MSSPNSAPAHSPATSMRASRWLAATVALVFLALFGRQHWFVDHYAVNVMFWDQWDFYQPVFDGKSWWAIFDYQHGPHRQGVGFLITRMVAEWSGWSSRADAFAVSFCLAGAAVLAFLLARRFTIRTNLALIAIPLLFFNIRQYEMFVGASNLSHGAMPILLFMIWSLAWFLRSTPCRLALLCMTNFLITFTGFGVFVGLLTPLILLIEMGQNFRTAAYRKCAGIGIALAFVAGSWALFAWHYHFNPAVEDFYFPYKHPTEYFYFAGLMFSNFHGIPGFGPVTIGAGVLLLGALAILCLWHGWRIWRNGVAPEARSVVIFSLSTFVLIYCANTAIGRVFLGLEQAPTASRYVTLMIPGGLAIFLHLATLPSPRLARWLSLTYALLLIPGTIVLRASDMSSVHWYSDGRKAWKRIYLQTHDERRADQEAGFQVYPAPLITERLQYLEQHHLNLFNLHSQP